MKVSLTLVVSIIAVVAAIFVANKSDSFSGRENFDAVGLVYNRPPEWFHKAAYNPDDWLVAYYPQQLAQPECMYKYRGNPQELNYLSSAYRFWRM